MNSLTNLPLNRILANVSDTRVRAIYLLLNKTVVSDAAREIGVPVESIKELLTSARLTLAANDSPQGDYLLLIEKLAELEESAGAGSMIGAEEVSAADVTNARSDDFANGAPQQSPQQSPPHASSPSAAPAMALDENLLHTIEQDWSVSNIRSLANMLNRLADSMDRGESETPASGNQSWPSSARRIEKNAEKLADYARNLMEKSRLREKYLSKEYLGEPAWNMLLELFIQFAARKRVSSKSLYIAAGCPHTTAHRYIGKLEEDGLIARTESNEDKRVTYVELTSKGVLAMGEVIENMHLVRN